WALRFRAAARDPRPRPPRGATTHRVGIAATTLPGAARGRLGPCPGGRAGPLAATDGGRPPGCSDDSRRTARSACRRQAPGGQVPQAEPPDLARATAARAVLQVTACLH